MEVLVMEVKLRQLQVQTSGTIIGFNYSYCKILYDEAIKLLKTDVVDGNGNIFPIDGNSLKELKRRLEKTQGYKWKSDFDEDETKFFQKNFSNKNILKLKQESILKNIFSALSDQMKESFELYIGGDPEKEVKDTLDFLDKVKKYLSMFE